MWLKVSQKFCLEVGQNFFVFVNVIDANHQNCHLFINNEGQLNSGFIISLSKSVGHNMKYINSAIFT